MSSLPRVQVLLRCATILGLAIAARASAQSMAPPSLWPDSTVLRRILKLEAAIEVAVEAHDHRALDTLYAPDFVWVHWDGSTDTRGSWFAFLDSVRYENHHGTTSQVAVYVNAAIVSGMLESRGRYVRGTRDFDVELEYARVYVYDPAKRRWLLREQLSRRPVSGTDVIGPR